MFRIIAQPAPEFSLFVFFGDIVPAQVAKLQHTKLKYCTPSNSATFEVLNPACLKPVFSLNQASNRCAIIHRSLSIIMLFFSGGTCTRNGQTKWSGQCILYHKKKFTALDGPSFAQCKCQSISQSSPNGKPPHVCLFFGTSHSVIFVASCDLPLDLYNQQYRKRFEARWQQPANETRKRSGEICEDIANGVMCLLIAVNVFLVGILNGHGIATIAVETRTVLNGSKT